MTDSHLSRIVQVPSCDAAAFLQKSAYGGAADPGSRAGHNYYFVVQATEFHVLGM